MGSKTIGVYEVRSSEPCHLIELEIRNLSDKLDLSEVTQEIPNQPRSNWQVPYDERYLDLSGACALDPNNPWDQPEEPDFRLVFFFHYLDFNKPLLTPFGAMALPRPTRKPKRLSFIDYESPH